MLALCITALAQAEIPRHSSLSKTTAPKGATSSRKFPGIQSVLGVIQAKKSDLNPLFYIKFFLIVFLLVSPRTGTVNAPKKKKKKVIFKISTAGAVPIFNLPKLQSAIFK